MKRYLTGLTALCLLAAWATACSPAADGGAAASSGVSGSAFYGTESSLSAGDTAESLPAGATDATGESAASPSAPSGSAAVSSALSGGRSTGTAAGSAPTGEGTKAPRPEVENGSLLHAAGSGHILGDVHPVYNETDKRWYMFYLTYQNGSHEPRLLVSSDMVSWTPRAISFTGSAPLQTYYVLGVLRSGGAFYSYFGNGYTMQSSKSADLLTWEYSRGTNIPNAQTLYPGGARDPYVFFDPDAGVYRCISTAYRTHDGMGIGKGMDVSIALSSTADDTLTTWQWDQRDLIRFPDGKQGEPEVAQAVKIGSRWYLTAAMLNRTNTVGKLSYWTGDAGKGLPDVDWQSKAERSLDGENLCAPQLAEMDGRQYLWGWIPTKAFGGSWGGHLSLGREVYALADGTLAVRLAEPVSQQIRGRLLERLDEAAVAASQSAALDGRFDRVDLQADTTTLSGKLVITIGNTAVVLDRSSQRVECRQGGASGKVYASAAFNQPIGDINTIRIVAEFDLIEIFVNDHTSLCARIDRPLDKAEITAASTQQARVALSAYRLRYREEIA